jgi:hypothetical protein
MLYGAGNVAVVLVFFIAVIVAFFYTTSRDIFRKVSEYELRLILPIMSLSSVLFALLATFTISNLWNRYQEIRQYLIDQLNKLKFLYRAVKSIDGTEEIQRDVKLYAESLAIEQLKTLAKGKPSVQTELFYKKLVNDVLAFTHKHEPTNRFVMFSNLYTGESGAQLLTPELNQTLYFIILLTAIFTLGTFWFLNIDDFEVQFLVDLFVLIIIGLVLYLIHELMNPFESDLLRESFKCIYSDFINELNRDFS